MLDGQAIFAIVGWLLCALVCLFAWWQHDKLRAAAVVNKLAQARVTELEAYQPSLRAFVRKLIRQQDVLRFDLKATQERLTAANLANAEVNARNEELGAKLTAERADHEEQRGRWRKACDDAFTQVAELQGQVDSLTDTLAKRTSERDSTQAMLDVATGRKSLSQARELLGICAPAYPLGAD